MKPEGHDSDGECFTRRGECFTSWSQRIRMSPVKTHEFPRHNPRHNSCDRSPSGGIDRAVADDNFAERSVTVIAKPTNRILKTG